MKTVLISKASPIAEPVESIEIRIEETIPEFKSFDALKEHASIEANMLESALYNVLPGAIYDRLFAHMASRKASALIVSHPS
jgi:hypothetical protein